MLGLFESATFEEETVTLLPGDVIVAFSDGVTEALNPAGLALRVKPTAGAAPTIGVRIQPENRGVRIISVRPGGAADRAGLSRDDLLISVDDQSLATEELPNRLKIYAPGAQAAFNVERHGHREIVMVTLDPPTPDDYSVEESRDATPEQVAIRNAWLGTQK